MYAKTIAAAVASKGRRTCTQDHDDKPKPIMFTMAQISRLQNQLFTVYEYYKLRTKRCDLLLSDEYLNESVVVFEEDHPDLKVSSILTTVVKEAEVGINQLREYVKQYFQYNGWLPDGRARDASTWISQNPKEKLELSNWLKSRNHNSKEETRNFINNTLFKDVADGTVICKATGLHKPVSYSTALNCPPNFRTGPTLTHIDRARQATHPPAPSLITTR